MVSKAEILTLKTHKFKANFKKFLMQGAGGLCSPAPPSSFATLHSVLLTPPFQNLGDAHGSSGKKSF